MKKFLILYVFGLSACARPDVETVCHKYVEMTATVVNKNENSVEVRKTKECVEWTSTVEYK
jgi:hypothetical protein